MHPLKGNLIRDNNRSAMSVSNQLQVIRKYTECSIEVNNMYTVCIQAKKGLAAALKCKLLIINVVFVKEIRKIKKNGLKVSFSRIYGGKAGYRAKKNPSGKSQRDR